MRKVFGASLDPQSTMMIEIPYARASILHGIQGVLGALDTVNTMVGRGMLRMDVGFYTEVFVLLRPLLNSLHKTMSFELARKVYILHIYIYACHGVQKEGPWLVVTIDEWGSNLTLGCIRHPWVCFRCFPFLEKVGTYLSPIFWASGGCSLKQI